MRTLVAGPFVGEFGWELMGWQAHIRHRSRGYDRTVAISRPEMEYLYRDFCDRFEPWSPGTWHTQGYECTGGRPYDGAIHARYPGADAFAIRRNRDAVGWVREAEWEYRRLGLDVAPERTFDLVVHARAIPAFAGPEDEKAQRNWPADDWNRLCGGLARRFSVAAIGRPELAIVPEGAVDCRHLPLDQQCALLARARCAIGPSSGPMHLAALCGCPHVVWMKAEQGIPARYARDWNPFQTKVCILTRDAWRPSPQLVLDGLRHLLSGRQTAVATITQ
ncbi:glycosyltransferase family 9 protein [Stella sp.]|uniref:glycosyltransferase family 9 protein n=1 Tax=Stella sp. TaxID=2912054 RepID=UPI0035B0141A